MGPFLGAPGGPAPCASLRPGPSSARGHTTQALLRHPASLLRSHPPASLFSLRCNYIHNNLITPAGNPFPVPQGLGAREGCSFWGSPLTRHPGQRLGHPQGVRCCAECRLTVTAQQGPFPATEKETEAPRASLHKAIGTAGGSQRGPLWGGSLASPATFNHREGSALCPLLWPHHSVTIPYRMPLTQIANSGCHKAPHAPHPNRTSGPPAGTRVGASD